MKSPNRASNAAFQIRAKEADAERILTGPFDITRKRIMELFRAGKTSMEIALDLNGSWPLENDDISGELKAGVIRKLLQFLATDEERRVMNSLKHSNRAQRNHASQNAARDAAMRERGMKVWSSAEKEYFTSLLNDPSYLRSEQKQIMRRGTRQRRKHYNHVALAAAMNKQFDTTDFTPERTMSRLEQLRAQDRLKDPEVRLSKLRANVRRKFDQAVSVAPLVVIPAEGFDETSGSGGLHFSELGVDDAAVTVSDDVLEDDRPALDS